MLIYQVMKQIFMSHESFSNQVKKNNNNSDYLDILNRLQK